jgi:hypothetical protein
VLDDIKDSFGKQKKLVLSFRKKPESNFWSSEYSVVDMSVPVAVTYNQAEKTIVLQSEKDVEQLLHALMTSEMLELNGGTEGLTLSSLQKDRMLLLPDNKNRNQFVVTDKAVDALHNTRFYYQRFVKALAHSYKDIDGLSAL